MERDTVIRTIGRLWYLAVALATLGLIALSAPYALSAHYLERTGGGPATATDLEQAIAWDARNVQARRTLAQVYLDQGRPEAALEALRPALGVTPPNPLAPIGSVALYVALGRPDAAIRAYEEAGLGMPSAPAAAAYLEQAETSEPQAAADLWQKALIADPGNLYALSRLWQAARAGGDDAATAGYEDNLRYFDLRAVAVPADARLADYQARAMADLVEAGVWTRETLLNVVSYQVWQFADGTAGLHTEQVLEVLLERWPEDTDLRFFKAELYHRHGQWERAEAAYRAVLEADVTYTQAYLRLGMVCQARDELATAADWYTRYHALAPDDLLGLKRLVEVGEVLGSPEVSVLRKQLMALSDDQLAGARLLKVSPAEVDLHLNMVENGDFGIWVAGRPAGWRPATCAVDTNPDLYHSARDNLAPLGTSVRTTALRGQQSAGCAEFVGRPLTMSAGTYLLSLSYRADYVTAGGAFVYLGEYHRRDGVSLVSVTPPLTHGQWHMFRTVVCVPAGTINAVPLFRNWGAGQLWVQSMEVRRIAHTKETCP
jgi:tetratricopeptide (TPR) repeat protein